ncbi:hypothetical protein Godav_003242 [Gossypium davidsonii]|uniref:Uncharacterized protein n=2 Tax=Gossypium TaxID=3633 RepID=A0A7J8SYK6_GOSDV|nr:hypothetical protein [Gossypium davidsonii]MBA0666937.1 hypothetical protein [Gossypium klotzschianum]
MTTCSMLTWQSRSVSGNVPDQILSNKSFSSVHHCFFKQMRKVIHKKKIMMLIT